MSETEVAKQTLEARLNETLAWCRDWNAGQFAPAYYDKTWPVEMFGLVSGLLSDLPEVVARLAAVEAERDELIQGWFKDAQALAAAETRVEALTELFSEMLVSPEPGHRSKLEAIAHFIDLSDIVSDVEGETDMQDDLRSWAVRARAVLSPVADTQQEQPHDSER